ncbi:hypothetical protein LLH00_08980 [bacterium]|nr:hypothetical protein [bacterium]
MKCLRGDDKHLSGRAVLLLDLKEPKRYGEDQPEMGLLAVFCAVSEMDMLELIVHVMHMPREHSRLISRFYTKYFQELENIKRSFPQRIARIIDEVVEQEQDEVPGVTLDAFREMFRRNAEVLPESGRPEQSEAAGGLPQPEFYSTLIPMPGKDFILPLIESNDGFEFDVFDLDRTESAEVGHLILEAQSRLYVADYMIQKDQQIDFPPEQEKYVSPYKKYREMPKEEFKRQLAELSSQLMFLIETKADTSRVFADLKQMTSGSYLLREVVSLYNVSTIEDPNRFKMMELYFRKIFALVDEDYLGAKAISDEIEKLNG